MNLLKSSTPYKWTAVALANFEAFLADHASCERKASAVGMSFVVRYPDRPALIEPMIHFAREELEHFHQVYRLMSQRKIGLVPDEEDAYVNRLLKHVRYGREERFLDRLLVSALIEARGFERLELVAEYLEDSELKNFYARLSRAEKTHRDLFYHLALEFFSQDLVEDRLEQLAYVESDAIASVPFRSALH